MGSVNVEHWVDAWIRTHIRTRILDGRPSKQFRDQLVKDVTQLVSELSAASEQPKKKGKADVSA